MEGINYCDAELRQALKIDPKIISEHTAYSVLAYERMTVLESPEDREMLMPSLRRKQPGLGCFSVHLITELLGTPHTLHGGAYIPSIQSSYTPLVRNLVRRQSKPF